MEQQTAARWTEWKTADNKGFVIPTIIHDSMMYLPRRIGRARPFEASYETYKLKRDRPIHYLKPTMQFNNFFFATVVAAVSASSAYAALVPRANPTCGTTEDATLSDCRNLVNSKWTDSMLNYDRTCTWGLIFRAYNPICSPGNCE
uniref:Uncharacterized protein n=1 Tax=Moniliophthora roreri TaxID=221103 RepID=A0A0W0FFZ2_MONRR